VGEDSISGKLRSIYTQNYSALDRFDRFYYQVQYPFSHRNWKAYFAWCVLQQALVNAFVAYMKDRNRAIPIRDFYILVVDEFCKEMEVK